MILGLLDSLEDYQPARPQKKTSISVGRIPIYNLERELIGEAWGYMMTPAKIAFHGGIWLPSGCWTGQ
jgi:gamma-glutamylcyclotransferase (GGCT)/AIG2-like uncharacterized protein YtfP